MMSSSESSAGKSSPYFVSRLSSQSVPANGDTTFSCKITGNPKPNITWCKNGRDINELEDFSNYEITDDNLIHSLHLFRCSEEQTGVYRIVASNYLGRVQSSAFLQVTPGAKAEVYKTLHNNPENNARTRRANEVTAYPWESSNQSTENKDDVVEKNDSSHECCFFLEPSEPPAPEFNGLSTEQTTVSHPMEDGICPPIENQHRNTHCLGDNTCAKNVLSPEENNESILDMTPNISDIHIYDSLEMSMECTEREMSRDCAEREVDTVNSSQVDSKPASQIDDHTNSCSFNAEDLAACQTTEYAKTHEEICLSEVLRKDQLSLSQTSAPLENQTSCLHDSYKNADNDSEILPSRTFITADDSFDNDHLEDLECSDVMTEETYQEWERKLQFLLESDDEDELKLGNDCDGCAYFLSEMPRLFQVSDNTVPMDATIGFCGHQSKSKEVAVRSYLTACNPSLLPIGMTLTVGQQQSKAPTSKDKEKYKQPVTSMAIENDYPRIEEENSSNSQPTEDSSVDRSQSMENELLGVEASSFGISDSSAATEKPDADRNFSQKNSQKFAKVREKVNKGEGKDIAAGLTKASKCPLNKLHPKELHTSKSHTIQRKRTCLGSAVRLHGCNRRDPKEAYQDTANSSTHYSLLHGKRGDKSPQEDKQISSPSEGNQLPNENAALMVKPQETEAETPVPIGNELKLFITEPEKGDGVVSTSPSPAKNISGLAENPALEGVSEKRGFPMDNAISENPTSLYLPHQTRAIDQQEPSWARTLRVTTVDHTVSHDVFLDTLHHTPSLSPPKGLCDILTHRAVPVGPAERRTVCRTKPHEVNGIKTICDSPCAEHLSKVDFPTTLECSEPEAREADLSLMHKQLQKLLYEEEGWDCDFTCTSREVKSLAAGSDPAKEAEGLNVTGDGSTEHQSMPGHLTEDNQLVTKLATALETVTEGCSDCDSLLKIDGICSSASMGKRSLALPVETDVVCLGAAFGHSAEKPSVHLSHGSLFDAEIYLDDDQRQTQSDNNGPIQKPASREGKIMTDNTSMSHAAESPFRFTDASNSPLECGRETLVEGAADDLGYSPSPKQDFHCADGAIAKQSVEIAAKNHHIALFQSRIKDGANLTELSPEEDSSSNLSGKNRDSFTSEGHSSVMAVDKSKEEKFQEKGTDLMNSQSDGNCGLYDVLTGNNSEDFQAIPDAGNYSYRMQEHNSVTAIASIADWGGPEDTEIHDAVFKTSYKGKFLSKVPLESYRNEENTESQERRDCRATAEETAPESETVLELLLPDSQRRISGGKPSIADNVCAIEKVMGMDMKGFTPDSGNTVAGIIRNVGSTSGQDSQDASNIVGIVCSQERNQEDENEERSMKALGAESFRAESLMPTESMHSKVEKDMSGQTPELRQDQYWRVEEEKKVHIVQYESNTGQRERSFPLDYGDAEVEPYMQALMDSEEQIHSWLDSIEPEQKAHQKQKEEKKTQIAPCERDTKAHQESLECDLEEVEAEPYMRVLMTSEQIHSWHENIHYLYPAGEQTGVSKGACISTSLDGVGAFTADESKNLNTPEHEMKASVSVVPCASEYRAYSEDKFLQGRLPPRSSAEPPDDPCALKEEKATLQGTSKLCRVPQAPSRLEDVKRKQETVKKKMVSKVQVKKPRLGAKENAGSNTSSVKKVSKVETGQREDKREQWKPPSEKESKAPKLLKKIQAELFPDFSGNIKLCCQFIEIHEDAIITWTKDSQLLARVQRSAGDEFPVSLAIVQAGKKDQGLYCCCLKNTYGKATADFNLTSEVLEHLSSFQDVEGLEEIEFLQLMFREDFICDSYFSYSLHGRITTEELHFGEGVHRKAFRSKVMQGLVPVFSPGHPCVLKVHNAIAYGTKNNDELVKRNYKLALQECYIQNTAREYAKIYAAEATQLEGFGEVPEIIPIFLIHRPKNNIPYATVEEELIGEFVKYSVKDGKEISFMRRDSEAGQKCCTFQHWVYERTGGSLLITDMQGVGMKLTDVGIATLAKGYKGFKGNCSISFIDQFKALHLCNKYCEMLGLKPLQISCQKLRKPAVAKPKAQQPSSSTVKKTGVSAQAVKKT